MNSPLRKFQPQPSDCAEPDVDETVRGLFRRFRGLAGFSVIDDAAMTDGRVGDRLEGNLYLVDIQVSRGCPNDYFGEIAVALVDLIDEHPEARALLRGRAFARSPALIQ